MTDDEWLARRKRIQDAVVMSNNRVKDFIELIAEMCVERTARRNARSKAVRDPLEASGAGRPEGDRPAALLSS